MLMCIATVTYHSLDSCNRPTSERRTKVLTAATEPSLLEALAAYKIRLERADQPEEAAENREDGEFCEVAFGDLLVIASATPCPDAALWATTTWKTNAATVQARQAQERVAAIRAAEDEAAAREAAALAAYHALKARFEPHPNTPFNDAQPGAPEDHTR